MKCWWCDEYIEHESIDIISLSSNFRFSIECDNLRKVWNYWISIHKVKIRTLLVAIEEVWRGFRDCGRHFELFVCSGESCEEFCDRRRSLCDSQESFVKFFFWKIVFSKRLVKLCVLFWVQDGILWNISCLRKIIIWSIVLDLVWSRRKLLVFSSIIEIGFPSSARRALHIIFA